MWKIDRFGRYLYDKIAYSDLGRPVLLGDSDLQVAVPTGIPTDKLVLIHGFPGLVPCLMQVWVR